MKAKSSSWLLFLAVFLVAAPGMDYSRLKAGDGEPVEFHGLLHFPLGQAILRVAPPASGDSHEHLTVSNIGSSGEDGVRIDLAGPADSWQMRGSFDSPGAHIMFAADGAVDGLPGNIAIAEIQPFNTSTRVLTVDFEPIGSTKQTIQAYLDGQIVGELRGHPNGEPAAFFDDSAHGVGFFKDVAVGPAGAGGDSFFDVFIDDLLEVRFPNGQVVRADRLRVLPEDRRATTVSFEGVRITAVGLPEFVIFDEIVPNRQLDHFLSYQIRALPQFQPRVVDLTDQFETGSFGVTQPNRLYNPADKNGEGIIDPRTHLMGYGLALLPGQPPHEPVTGITVANQFGSLIVDTIQPVTLLVPSAKTLSPPLPPPPDPDTHRVDHFKCYQVRITPGTPPFPSGIVVSVADQFEQPKRYDVLGPRSLCNPADKNGEGIKNPEAHLMCYGVQPVEGEPLHQRVIGLTNNQFAPQLFVTFREGELCLPSEKILP